MKKIVYVIASLLVVFILLLFCQQNYAFAANWVYLQRHEATRYGACSEYFDADSVVANNNEVIYWIMWVLDDTASPGNPQKILWKNELMLKHHMYQRRLATYQFDSAGNQAVINNFIYLGPQPFYKIDEGSREEALLLRILPYAKANTASNADIPDYSTVSQPKWYGFLQSKEGDVYWDIHSIVVWPGDKPANAEITVKIIWNHKNLEKRKAELMAKQYRHDGYSKLKFTKYTYKFMLDQNKAVILSETDYEAEGSSINLTIDPVEHPIKAGSIADMAKKLALNWIKNKSDDNLAKI